LTPKWVRVYGTRSRFQSADISPNSPARDKDEGKTRQRFPSHVAELQQFDKTAQGFRAMAEYNVRRHLRPLRQRSVTSMFLLAFIGFRSAFPGVFSLEIAQQMASFGNK
jgi:hypothetical protein